MNWNWLIPRIERLRSAGLNATAYMIRYQWSWGCLHHFLRGDIDLDFHTHKQAFWTFPFSSYVEEVFHPATGLVVLRKVEAWRWHYRSLRFAHRVLGRWSETYVTKFEFDKRVPRGTTIIQTRNGGFWTMVIWTGPRMESWGFWLRSPTPAFVEWRDYIFGKGGEPLK
jgi:hypothetical protein